MVALFNRRQDFIPVKNLPSSNDWDQQFFEQLRQSVFDAILGSQPMESKQIEEISKRAIRNVAHLLESGELDKDEAELLLKFIIAELISARMSRVSKKFDSIRRHGGLLRSTV